MISTIIGIVTLLFGLYLKWRFHIQFVMVIHRLVKVYKWSMNKYKERNGTANTGRTNLPD